MPLSQPVTREGGRPEILAAHHPVSTIRHPPSPAGRGFHAAARQLGSRNWQWSMLRSACAVIAAGIRVSAECARFWNGQGTTGLLVRSVPLRGRQTVSSRMASESQTGTSRQTAHRQMGTYIVPYRTPGGCVDGHTVSPLVATHANRLESYRPSPHRLHQSGRSPRLPALSSSMRTPNRTPFGPLKSTRRPTSNPDIATQMTATPSRTTPSLPVLASCSSPPSYAVQYKGISTVPG